MAASPDFKEWVHTLTDEDLWILRIGNQQWCCLYCGMYLAANRTGNPPTFDRHFYGCSGIHNRYRVEALRANEINTALLADYTRILIDAVTELNETIRERTQ